MSLKFEKFADECEGEVQKYLSYVKQLFSSDAILDEDIEKAYRFTVAAGSEFNKVYENCDVNDDEDEYIKGMEQSYKEKFADKWSSAFTKQHSVLLKDKAQELINNEVIDKDTYEQMIGRINSNGKNDEVFSPDIYFRKAMGKCSEIQSGVLPEESSVSNNINYVKDIIGKLLDVHEFSKARELSDKLITCAGDYQTQVEFRPHEIRDKQEMKKYWCTKDVNSIWVERGFVDGFNGVDTYVIDKNLQQLRTTQRERDNCNIIDEWDSKLDDIEDEYGRGSEEYCKTIEDLWTWYRSLSSSDKTEAVKNKLRMSLHFKFTYSIKDLNNQEAEEYNTQQNQNDPPVFKDVGFNSTDDVESEAINSAVKQVVDNINKCLGNGKISMAVKYAEKLLTKVENTYDYGRVCGFIKNAFDEHNVYGEKEFANSMSTNSRTKEALQI